MESVEKKPKVSVCVVTYNQEEYIGQCLQSIVDQVTDFDFEVIIGDDCSTDRTALIIKEFESKYPEIIRSFKHECNVGAVANVVYIYRQARGKYIAHMDGDDFSLPGKLQAQFNVLETHKDCIICSHDVILVDKVSNKVSDFFIKHKAGPNSLMDLYERLPFFAHSSKMFINDESSDLYESLTFDSIDIELHVAQAKKGKIYHLKEALGAYRVFSGMSVINGRVNILFPKAIHSIFLKALTEHKLPTELSRLKKYYARSILNYSYQSAIYGAHEDFRKYAIESVNIKIISFLQICILIFSFFPKFGVYIARRRFNNKLAASLTKCNDSD